MRQREGRGPGEFATLTISLPLELMERWNAAYELAERVSGTKLEEYEVPEPMLADIATYMASEEYDASPHETD